MKKRSAKKYMQYRIADAIDIVLVSESMDEKLRTKKIDDLVQIYDDLLPEVNKVRRLDKIISRKKYFNDIFARLKKEIDSVTGIKK